MNEFEYFYLVDVAPGRWIVRHQITDEFGGTILQTSGGYRLRDENARTVGNFSSIEGAMSGLYASV